jgi:hypothetical protein
VEHDRARSLEALVAETRATVGHIAGDLSGLRQEARSDIRRLDQRIFQLMLLQLATLATALVSLVAALVS